MSFILDALKKSEIERQRQTVPGLMDPGAATPRARFPLWAVGLGTLLGINLVVLCLFLMQGGHGTATPRPTAPLRGSIAAVRAAAQATSGTAEVTPPTALPASPPAAADGANHFSPMDGAATYAPEIPLTAADADVEDSGEAPTTKSAPGRSEPTLRAPANRSAEPPDEVLPSISELNLTGVEALPELHLDVHVYATNPADRFVYINMHKYREGAQLQEGPTLERIRRDGVVLNSQGIRFLLPRDR
jgi:general secretion pathway protein B